MTTIHTMPIDAKGKQTAELEWFAPVLTVRERKKVSDYVVVEFACQLDGRAFQFRKDTGDTYECFVARNGQDDLCDCRGFVAHGHCKHVSAAKILLEAGEFDRMESDRPTEAYPSPQQLADEAGVELPF